MLELSVRDARRLALEAQGLLRPAGFGRGKKAARRVIETLGYVQIDTISVIERAHFHVLRSRVPNFDARMLDRLQRIDRTVFEYWSHAAAYLPMQDYRFFQPMMAGFERSRKIDRKMAKVIFERIKADGPVQSRDFEAPPGQKSGGWWDWKPAKVTLEQLFLSGQVMISHREGFQKFFDLPERVIPADIDTEAPSTQDFARYFVRTWARSMQIGTEYDLTYPAGNIQQHFLKNRTPVRKDFIRAIHELVEDGELIPVTVNKKQHYAQREALERLPIRLGPRRISLLSPFDNLVINRRRLATLFDFDYQIECYVPGPKRQFGYFCLPILWGDEMIGRLDPKAHRDKGILEIKALHFEPGVNPDEPRLKQALDNALTDLATANGCSEVQSQP